MFISFYELMARVIISVILGGAIGLERENVNRPAGFRTHILVCVGSTVTMLVSLHMFDTFKGAKLDIARIPAQVISGIGFLGAGTIIMQGNTVKGLTTAASLWTVASIGLAIGCGFYEIAFLATTLTVVVLKYFAKFEKWYILKSQLTTLSFQVDNDFSHIKEIENLLYEKSIEIINIKVKKISKGQLQITVVTEHLPGDLSEAIRNELRTIPGVGKIWDETKMKRNVC